MIINVKLELGSSIALPRQGMLLGDALLHAAATRLIYPDAANRTPDQWEPIELPVNTIQTDAGPVYAVSAMITPRAVPHTDTIYKRSWEYFRENERSSGKLKASMSQLNLIAVPYVEFLVDTDKPDELRPIIERLHNMGIGAKTNVGFGHIIKVSVARSDSNSAVVDEHNTVLRPIPVTYAEKQGYQGVKRLHAVAPPYFAAPMVVCMVRDFNALIIKSQEDKAEVNE